jgi:hypothetical protein
VAVLTAACGSGSQVQYNYGLLANEICGKLTDQTSGPTTAAARVGYLETALSGLEGLNPPSSPTQNLYFELVGNFKAAIDALKPNVRTLHQLAKHLQKHPDDKTAAKKYQAIAGSIQSHLHSAATEAHTLGLGRCEKAFGGV